MAALVPLSTTSANDHNNSLNPGQALLGWWTLRCRHRPTAVLIHYIVGQTTCQRSPILKILVKIVCMFFLPRSRLQSYLQPHQGEKVERNVPIAPFTTCLTCPSGTPGTACSTAVCRLFRNLEAWQYNGEVRCVQLMPSHCRVSAVSVTAWIQRIFY